MTFSRDQALVLSHWLDGQLGSADFDRLVDQDPAVWSAIYRLTALLNNDPIVFSAGYAEALEGARVRLRDELGAVFIAGRVTGEVLSATSRSGLLAANEDNGQLAADYPRQR